MAQSTNDTFPTVDARGDARQDPRLPAGARRADRRVRGAGARLRPRAQVGPDAHAGRGADPPRAGVRGLCADAAPREANASRTARDGLLEQNIGATAVGTGLNAQPEYIELVVEKLSEQTGHELRTRRAARPGDAVDGAHAGGVGVAARAGRRPGQDPRGPAAHVVRVRAPVLPRSNCRPSSRARRSCPARSTR